MDVCLRWCILMRHCPPCNLCCRGEGPVFPNSDHQERYLALRYSNFRKLLSLPWGCRGNHCTFVFQSFCMYLLASCFVGFAVALPPRFIFAVLGGILSQQQCKTCMCPLLQLQVRLVSHCSGGSRICSSLSNRIHLRGMASSRFISWSQHLTIMTTKKARKGNSSATWYYAIAISRNKRNSSTLW